MDVDAGSKVAAGLGVAVGLVQETSTRRPATRRNLHRHNRPHIALVCGLPLKGHVSIGPAKSNPQEPVESYRKMDPRLGVGPHLTGRPQRTVPEFSFGRRELIAPLRRLLVPAGAVPLRRAVQRDCSPWPAEMMLPPVAGAGGPSCGPTCVHGWPGFMATGAPFPGCL